MGFMAAVDLPALLEEARHQDMQSVFVVGEQDHWVPERPLGRIIEASFPKARVLRWEGGHLLHEAEPERAARVILDVLSEAVGDHRR
jgi:magnesium chelatase accessory protein